MSAPEKFDLVVIGSGPAGEKGAAMAAYFGKKVAIVERRPAPGGASVHTGTLPSKTLREAALYLTGFRRRELYGMRLHLDRRRELKALLGRLADVTNTQTRQILRNVERHRITLIAGSGRFLDARTVGVFAKDGTERARLTAEAFLVATGSSPLPPRGVTFEDPDVEDSDSLLALDRIPDSLVVVGGGVIGCEYASIFAALGTRVRLVEGRDRLLGFLDGELSAALVTALERMGGEVLLGDGVETIARVPGKKRSGLRLVLKSGRALAADKVLFSAGRRGNTEGMGLEAAGVALDAKGLVPVDASFRTNVPGIYAAGDVIGFPALASTSMEQGRLAVAAAFDMPSRRDMATLLPYGVYTVPEISMVGATEEELRALGTPYEVGRSRYENNARGQITGDPDGFVKILFHPETRALLGAHLIGGSATELVHIPQMVMAFGGTIDTFLAQVFNFPTLSECFKYAAYDGLQRLAHRADATPMAVPASDGRSLPPAARAWFVGLELSDPASSAPRAASVAEMDRWRRLRFRTWTYEPDGRGLLTDDMAAEGFVLAIGAPRALPERPSRRAPEGSARLFAALRASGVRLAGEGDDDAAEAFEAAPDALFRAWAGRWLPKKSSPAGRRARWDLLRGFGLELPKGPDAVTHDQLDAAACAFAAYLRATGKLEPGGARREAGTVRGAPAVG